MWLLTGPPGSGKSWQVLERVRALLRRNASDFRLLAPTATMAEHLRNQLAREGLCLRPRLVATFSQFIDEQTPDVIEVSTAWLSLLVEDAIGRRAPEAFRQVAGLPGLHDALARLIDELSSAGFDAETLAGRLREHLPEAPVAEAALDVFREVEEEVQRRGWVLRCERLQRVAARIKPAGVAGLERVYFDGFFSFTEPELGVLGALARHADLTVTLPAWAGAGPARAALRAMGLDEVSLEARRRPRPRVTVVEAPSAEQEAEDLARRILEENRAGRLFREMGIVLRGEEPYLPVLRNTLRRFGIPARFYFAPPLAKHPAVSFLAKAVEAMLGGWDHGQALAALRAAPSLGMTDVLDRFEFEVLRQLPNRGLDALKGLARDHRLRRLLDEVEALEAWRTGAAGGAEWAARAAGLRALIRPPEIGDAVDHDTAAIWRSTAAALDAFAAAMEEAGQYFAGPVPFIEFWARARRILDLSRLRVQDGRRNVVHVMDVYEARQWELPVVFVCGLLEKQFPQYHPPDCFLGDRLRSHCTAGALRLRTTADRDEEERFLFEVAVSRASWSLALSYPALNAQGEETLPSFALTGFLREVARAHEQAQPAAPEPVRPRVEVRPMGLLRDARLLEETRRLHGTLSPTAIETFLQCPFQFFAARSLGLLPPPDPPQERMNALAQGRIVHDVIAEWQQTKGPIEEIFARHFWRICDEYRIPPGHRSEAARVAMLRDLRRFAETAPEHPGRTVHIEQKFQFPLAGGIEIAGRIDRFDTRPDGDAIAFEFKYSSDAGIQRRFKETVAGGLVQGGLYLLALREFFKLKPSALYYYGIREDSRPRGWATPEQVAEQIEQARARSLEVAAQIFAGRVEAAPAERAKCAYCDYSDVCRIELLRGTAVAEAAAP